MISDTSNILLSVYTPIMVLSQAEYVKNRAVAIFGGLGKKSTELLYRPLFLREYNKIINKMAGSSEQNLRNHSI
jgi:hypothetical protein